MQQQLSNDQLYNKKPITFCFLFCERTGSSDSSLSLSSEVDSSVLDDSDSLTVKYYDPNKHFTGTIVLFRCGFFENFCFKLASTSPASVELLLSSSDELSSELSSSVLSPLPDSVKVHHKSICSI